MSNIKVYCNESQEAKVISSALVKRSKPINYKQLAGKILTSEPNTIIKVPATKDNYTNIKRGLERRKLKANIHYKIAFYSRNGENAFYITVLG